MVGTLEAPDRTEQEGGLERPAGGGCVLRASAVTAGSSQAACSGFRFETRCTFGSRDFPSEKRSIVWASPFTA